MCQSGLHVNGETHGSGGVCPVPLPILPLIPQPAQDCLERLVLLLPTLHFEPLTCAALCGFRWGVSFCVSLYL